jgi:hypothetical protein
MEPLYKKVLNSWHLISTLQKDEKLIVHAGGYFSKDPYHLGQYVGRRILGHGLIPTQDGLEDLWDKTTALADLLTSDENLNQVKHHPIGELKDLEVQAYKERKAKYVNIYNHLRDSKEPGLKNLVETYNRDCKIIQLSKQVDQLVQQMEEKLAQLQRCEETIGKPVHRELLGTKKPRAP